MDSQSSSSELYLDILSGDDFNTEESPPDFMECCNMDHSQNATSDPGSNNTGDLTGTDTINSLVSPTKSTSSGGASAASTSSSPVNRQHPQNQGRGRRAFIGNLTWWTTEEDIITCLEKIDVKDCIYLKIMENRANGHSKGYCTVTVTSNESRQIMLEKMSKEEIHGRNPIVSTTDEFGSKYGTGTNENMRRQIIQNSYGGPESFPHRPPPMLRNMGAPGQWMPGAGPMPIPTAAPGGPQMGPPGFMGGPEPSATTHPQMVPYRSGMPPQGGPFYPNTPEQMQQNGMPPGPPQPHMFHHQQGPPHQQNFQGPPCRFDGQRPPHFLPREPAPGIPNQFNGQHPYGPRHPGPGPRGPASNGAPDFNRYHWRPNQPTQMQSQNGQSQYQNGTPPGDMQYTQAQQQRPEFMIAPPRPHLNPEFLNRFAAPIMPRPLPPDPYNQNYPAEHVPRFKDENMKGQSPARVQQGVGESESEKLVDRNRSVASAAISRAVADAAYGDREGAMETLVTAISLISDSKVADDERCKLLTGSLNDTLRSVKMMRGKYDVAQEERRRHSRSRSDERRVSRLRRSYRGHSQSPSSDERRRRDRSHERERERHHNHEPGKRRRSRSPDDYHPHIARRNEREPRYFDERHEYTTRLELDPKEELEKAEREVSRHGGGRHR